MTMRVLRVGLLGLLLVVGGLGWLVPPILRAQASISFDEYHRAVAQALALTQQASALPSSERATLLNRAANELESIRLAQTPSGANAAIDNSELLTLLRDANKTEIARARLAALEDALAQPLANVSANDLSTLRDILSRPPFTATENWYDAILRALQEFLDRLFQNTAQGVFDARDILVVLALLAVGAVLVYFFRTLRRNLVDDQELPMPLLENDARTPAEAFDNAERFIHAGDLRSAVRQLYLATLLLLDQRGRIKYDPTLTNREYLRQAARDPRAAAALEPIVETFDRTWYGSKPISRQEFETYRRRVEQVREL